MKLLRLLNVRTRFARARVALAGWNARRIEGGPPLPRISPDAFHRIRAARRILIGAGQTGQEGWVSTDQDTLDLTHRAAFRRYWRPGSVEAFCAEHVWEHLDATAARLGVENCFIFLRPGGTLRIAVPDGLHPSSEYREHVRPGGTGPGAGDHKIFHTKQTLCALLGNAGFTARPVEWWDESGQFHAEPWSPEQGHIQRSAKHDPRNESGELRYTSLIVDGTKPAKT